MKVELRRSIATRIYLFAIGCLAIVVVTQIFMILVSRSTRGPHPRGGTIQAVTETGEVVMVRTPVLPPPRGPGLELWLGILAVLVLLLGLSWWFSRGLTRRLASLADAAERFGRGEPAVVVDGAGTDELGQVGAAFNAMTSRIASLLDTQRSMIANVSHELRTPLSRIRVALELASEDQARAQSLLGGLAGDLAELDRLIDDLLTMTRLRMESSGSPPLRRESARPLDLADRAAVQWRHRHGARPLDVQVDAALPLIDADVMLLRRVIDNLLDNAAKYSSSEARVVLRAYRDDAHVAFEVEDAGVGMTAEEIEHAFTPFWRADTSRTRDTGGVGLGLALAQQIAHAHGGGVTLDSEPGSGTRAILRIPCAAFPSVSTGNAGA